MTLLDAPVYDEARARKRRNLLIGLGVLAVILAGLAWNFWYYPQEQKVNEFFAAVEAKDFPKAFAIWNNDPDWQKHPDKYPLYPYGKFVVDWGPSSDFGVITSHKILLHKPYGTGVVYQVQINGRPAPGGVVHLWVEKKAKTLGFSPVQLE